MPDGAIGQNGDDQDEQAAQARRNGEPVGETDGVDHVIGTTVGGSAVTSTVYLSSRARKAVCMAIVAGGLPCAGIDFGLETVPRRTILLAPGAAFCGVWTHK